MFISIKEVHSRGNMGNDRDDRDLEDPAWCKVCQLEAEVANRLI